MNTKDSSPASLEAAHGSVTVESSAVVLPRPMREAPLDGTHVLAHNGDQYFPPVVVHFFGGSWYVSKWPDDCDNIYFPKMWWALPQWQNKKGSRAEERE